MFSKKYADRLEEEPIAVSIGKDDEVFYLRPMDPQTMPRKSEFKEIISLMKTKQDWQHLVPFVSGLRMARWRLKRNQWEYIVRKAGDADALGAIIECAKQSARTGLRLDDKGIVRRLFFALHRKAQLAEFEEAATLKALTLAKEAITLMESPSHLVHDVLKDSRRMPFVIGVLLELNAARAVNHRGGEDTDGAVRKYALRLLGTLEVENVNSEPKNWYDIDQMLQENVPIQNAVKLALQVNGIAATKSLSEPLTSQMEKLRTWITKQRDLAPQHVKNKPSLGYKESLLL